MYMYVVFVTNPAAAAKSNKPLLLTHNTKYHQSVVSDSGIGIAYYSCRMKKSSQNNTQLYKWFTEVYR